MIAAVEARGLEVARGGVTVLGPLDLVVGRGEFLVVAGPNGSGKSTLLGALAGHIRPGRGRVAVLGARVGPAPALVRTVAYLSQFPEHVPPFSVEMTVLLGRAPRQGLLGRVREEDRRAARRAMALTQVAHLGERSLTSLSGGERRRVLLAQALCREPELLLLDEPSAGLDPGHQMFLWDMLEQLRQESGVTVVLVSHDLNPAAAYAQRMLLLRAGRVAALGPAEQVLTASVLTDVYAWPMSVEAHPVIAVPQAVPLPGVALGRRKGRDAHSPGG